MALWGNAVWTQMIWIPTQKLFKGRSAFTAAAWAVIPSTPLSVTHSYWRTDLTCTVVQRASVDRLRPAWWNQSGVRQDDNGATRCYFDIGYDQWRFYVLSFSPRGVVCYDYSVGRGVVQFSESCPWGGAINEAGTAPMIVGGTENFSELMPANSAIAELMILDEAITPQAIPKLAHNPALFRDSLLFYAPLRDPAAQYTERVGGRQFRMEFGPTTRQQMNPARHPPVTPLRIKGR